MNKYDNERFAFGHNWQAFLGVLDEERVLAATNALCTLLGTQDLAGKRFLDIGCGSGLSSLAARRLGARVHSFDYDPQSVACTRHLRQIHFQDDLEWTVEQGSALDQGYLSGLGSWDYVYSWGVLHHTGDMWRAINNTVPLVTPRGTLVLAIYNHQGFTTKLWTLLKRFYVRSPKAVRLVLAGMVCAYFEWWHMVDRVYHGQTPLPFRDWREYRANRGMSRWHDYVDWTGGYPFEAAAPDQIFAFAYARGFELTRLKTMGGGLGCNEFVFVRK